MKSAGINGYFQIIIIEGDIKLRIFPPKAGGDILSVQEVSAYLDKNHINGYDIKEINSAVSSGTEVNIHLPSQEIYPLREQMSVKISDDNMKAFIRFYPPSNNGERMAKEEIVRGLGNYGVASGINDKVITNHILSPEYCQDIEIATGKPCIPGTNASIEYSFRTVIDARPKRNEDGTVDFHQLDIMNHIKAGDLLATLTREVPGEPGLDVRGNLIQPPPVIKKILRYGKNVTISEDETQIFAATDGHVTLEDERVYVYNVYEVAADVDATTGDIQYDGNIVIKGNVRGGFNVTASGNVEINGVVEAATVKAGGDVVLKRGIQGQGKGIIVSKGNIITKFIESATVFAEGFIETESVMHSRISARGDIKIQGSKGVLIGGFTKSTTLIEAKVIGAPMGTVTNVEVGTDPELKERITRLQEEMTNKTKEMARIKEVIDTFKAKKELGKFDLSKVSMLNKSIVTYKEYQQSLFELKKAYEEARGQLTVNESAKIVGKTVYPGVKICISGEVMYVDSEIVMMQFRKINGEIEKQVISY